MTAAVFKYRKGFGGALTRSFTCRETDEKKRALNRTLEQVQEAEGRTQGKVG